MSLNNREFIIWKETGGGGGKGGGGGVEAVLNFQQ